MPDFATAFTVKASDRILTHNELVRAIRLMIADEFEAVQVYTQLAESIDNELAREVLLDIADEERVHAGEFQRLLFELAPGEKELYAQGAVEVEEKIAGLVQKVPGTTGSGQPAPGEMTVGSLKK
ncbi:MAG TPA: ferritin family protein [Methanoregulaceae archaeon]|nr:ferritin family protein [Methanoregulaceae archaeon]